MAGGKQGVNVEALQALSRSLTQSADELEQLLRSGLGGLTLVALADSIMEIWRGNRSNRFAGVWGQQHLPMLQQVVVMLRSAAEQAAENAVEQTGASSTLGGLANLPGGFQGPRGPGTPFGPGGPFGPVPFPNDRIPSDPMPDPVFPDARPGGAFPFPDPSVPSNPFIPTPEVPWDSDPGFNVPSIDPEEFDGLSETLGDIQDGLSGNSGSSDA